MKETTVFFEAVVVSIGFGDFLATTLPINRPVFDRLIIVTSPEDECTKALAREHDCDLVITSRHKEAGPFNAGKVINDGLDACTERGWLAQIDADIVLPENFRLKLFSAVAHVFSTTAPKVRAENTVFGLHRSMCRSREEWEAYLLAGEHTWLVEKLRKRSHPPAGYFQLWYAKGHKVRYPEDYPTCASGDLAFSRQFCCRRHLTSPQVIHLATKSKATDDHGGRVSPKW